MPSPDSKMRSRVHPIQDVAKAHSFFTDQTVRRNAQVGEENLRRVVVNHRIDRPNLNSVANRLL